MSVPKSQRTDKSDVCYLAGQIEYKVTKMTMNEKYFPKRARFIITNKVLEAAMNIAANFEAANAIYPTKESYLEEREKYQIVGKANIAVLEHFLNLAYKLFNIPSTVLDDVFSDITELKKMYSNWVKAGRKILQRELLKQQQKKENKNEIKKG